MKETKVPRDERTVTRSCGQVWWLKGAFFISYPSLPSPLKSAISFYSLLYNRPPLTQKTSGLGSGFYRNKVINHPCFPKSVRLPWVQDVECWNQESPRQTVGHPIRKALIGRSFPYSPLCFCCLEAAVSFCLSLESHRIIHSLEPNFGA